MATLTKVVPRKPMHAIYNGTKQIVSRISDSHSFVVVPRVRKNEIHVPKYTHNVPRRIEVGTAGIGYIRWVCLERKSIGFDYFD